MLPAAITISNQIELAEVQTSLFIFYYQKVNPFADDDNNIAGVDEAPEITGVNGYTYDKGAYEIKHEDPHDEYDTTHGNIYEYTEKN